MNQDLNQKAVILARGLGTRMRQQDESVALDEKQAEIAASGMKAMIFINGRPFLDYVLSELADAGFTKVCLVIGPEHHAIRDYYCSLSASRIEISFAIQEKPIGTADAVLAAESFAGDDRFLIINSDNYYPLRAFEMIRTLRGAGLVGFERERLVFESNFPRERVLKFAVMKLDENGFVERVYEKPDEEVVKQIGEEIFVSMTCWLFTKKIFEACRNITFSKRNELELADAIQYAIDVLDERFKLLPIHAGVLDLSSRADIASVAEVLKGKEIRL